MKRKAVFLDRDGTINNDGHHLSSAAEFNLIPGVAQAIRGLNERGYLTILVTNQGGLVGKGELTEDELREIHELMHRLLRSEGARLDGVYYCPHHPEATIDRYREICECRKPNPGMIRMAERDFDIDLDQSFMIGDMTTDIAFGERAGIRTILLQTGHAGGDGRYPMNPDFIASDLLEAVRIIDQNAE